MVSYQVWKATITEPRVLVDKDTVVFSLVNTQSLVGGIVAFGFVDAARNNIDRPASPCAASYIYTWRTLMPTR